MIKGSPKVKVRFLHTGHYSTVGGYQAGQVAEFEKEEGERILGKFESSTERVAEKAPEKAEGKPAAKTSSKKK